LVTPQILCSLLQLARPYKIDGLFEAVVERLHESLDGRNAAAIFNAAAMGAGGGDGVQFVSEVPAPYTHPPRSASLAGINIEGLDLNNTTHAGPGPLRVDTHMANGANQGSRSNLRDVDDQITEEDDEVPDSASTTASMSSQMSLARRRSRREDREIWEGGWSAVIGLQKRGLRGLMEGRRIRERGGRNDGGGAGTEGTRVGLGIA